MLLIAFLAAGWDIRRGRIPNRLIVIGLLWGLSNRLATMGVMGIAVFVLNSALPMILLYILFLQRTLGAGDIKLFSVLSVFMNTDRILLFILISFLIGGALSFIKILHRKQLVLRLEILKDYTAACVSSKKILRYSTIADESSYIPFGICIWMGTIFMAIGELFEGYFSIYI